MVKILQYQYNVFILSKHLNNNIMKQLKQKFIESLESGMFLVYYFGIPTAAYFVYVAFEIFSK